MMRASVVCRCRAGEEDRRRHAVLLDRYAHAALAHELRLAANSSSAAAHAIGERRVCRAPLLGRIVEQAHEGL